ncbi:hypothetical protein [Clostridium sp. DJ247]|nr:hypothetical protein [Clostridium sp. DJ247]
MKDGVYDDKAKKALREYIDAYKKYAHIVTTDEAKKYRGLCI